MTDNEVLLKKIGDNLRDFRKEKTISQQELADISNIAKSTVQRIENGKHNPTIIMLHSICKSLDITLISFLIKEV